MSSTRAARSGLVSFSKATATSFFTPILRACSAKRNGSERLPAIIPMVSMWPDIGLTKPESGADGNRFWPRLTKMNDGEIDLFIYYDQRVAHFVRLCVIS